MNRYLRAVSNPLETALHLVGSQRPELLWRRYGRLAKKVGLKKLYLVLSFDCDTPEDAGVVLDLDERLRDLGAKPVYAVPGALLAKDEKVYGMLLHRGAEFLNHGHEQHTVWNRSLERYESCLFYHQLPKERVRQDIEQGHRAFETVLGLKPLGFRAPHFGTFQTTAQLSYLHRVLGEMGYQYSSSTMPFHAFRYGPVFNRFGLLEFPVSGAFSSPVSVQDSWSFYAAPGRKRGADDFLAEAQSLVKYCEEEKMVGILNYYADPSHVYNQTTFFEAVKAWSEVAQPAEFKEFGKGIL